MQTSSIYIIGAFVLLAIFVLIARLAVRMIIRLTMVGVILIALLGGGIFWWWTNRLISHPPENRSRPTPTRRTTTS